ncbi:MAG: hypothetical protein JNK48_17550 [Bryobacterales bacterium]|nr:hypothetical protein [Bryobacterales bacterium]
MFVLLFAAGAADWRSKAFPDWDEDTVLRVLTDSPWANARTVKLEWRKREDQPPITYKDVPGADPARRTPVGSPVGGIGGKVKETLPDRADLIFRWASALPVRHARALYQLRDEKLPVGRLNAMIGVPQENYVLEVFGLPIVMAHQGTGSIEAVFRQGTTLRTKSGRLLRPVKVEAVLGAAELTVRIHFARTNPLTEKDREIEIAGDVQVMEFREKFKLGTMIYQGRLEL